ncbi:hypothetical protein ACCS63_36700, partial [Rhizobium brockwellii]|uniref:hypothetical protein n=1 Tax=Rhizobium brockwellii TaxID=3019932 RepID=UPI003F9C6E57
QEAGDHVFQLDVGVKGKNFWVTKGDLLRAREWFGAGFTMALKTPDNTIGTSSEIPPSRIVSRSAFTRGYGSCGCNGSSA